MASAADPSGQPKRLKLTMPSPDGQTPLRGSQFASSPAARASTERGEEDRSSTPPRPSYSPVTPVMSHANISGASVKGASNHSRQPEWMDEPPAVPMSIEENPDAIAVQAALSVLQLQKQQAVRDIQNLNKTKAAALQDPEAFLKDLKTGKLTEPSEPSTTIIAGDDTSESESSDVKPETESSTTYKTTRLPEMQSVVRCPPVNWAKYRIVGESLDKLHDEQRKRPEAGAPRIDELPPEHVIAAPYRPFADKLEASSPMQTRGGSRPER
ncbi:MAG: hypothetical protein Q9227_004233 [Pyrenula ochraceoflavens]